MTSTVSTVVAHYARCSMGSLTGLVPVSACAFHQLDVSQQPRHYLQHHYRKFGVNNGTALTRSLFERLPDSMAPGPVI